MIKNYNLTARRLAKSGVLFAAMFSLLGVAKAQLSGTVTVGSGGTYANLSALASAISSNGIGTGGLTANLVSNISESGRVTFSQNGSNPATSTKTVTIDGKGYTVTSSVYNDAGIVFNCMDYMTIKNMDLNRTSASTDAKGIQFMGNAQYNELNGVTIRLSQTSGTTSTSSGGAYIVFSASITSMTSYTSSYHSGSYNTVQNCTMKCNSGAAYGPTIAICDRGSSSKYTSTPTNNTFKNNTIENYYYFAYYNYYTNGNQFLNNEITRKTSQLPYSSSRVAYMYYTYSTNRSTKFDGNHVHDLPYAGATSGQTSTFYLAYMYRNYGTASNPVSFSDNVFEDIVVNSSSYYVYGYYNYYAKYNGNTIRNWTSTGSTSYHYGFYIYYSYNGFQFNNNHIENVYTRYYTYFAYFYYGYGSGASSMSGNTIKKCQTSQTNNAYTYCMYMYRPVRNANNHFDENTIDSCDFGYYTYGLYHYYYEGTHNRNRITNNQIKKSSGTTYGYIYSTYGYYFYNYQCNNNIIANNLGYYGLMGLYQFSYNSGSYKAEFKNNTIQVDATNAGYAYHYTYGLYVYPYYHQKIQTVGNVIDIRNSYGAYPAYTYNTGGATPYTWDYNNYYIKNISYQYWYSPNGNAGNLSAWKNLGFAGDHETGHEPIYRDISKGDYSIDVFELQNKVPAINGLWPSTTTPIVKRT